MPIYEYDCQECGLRFERMKSITKSDTPERCPACKTPDARKIMSVVNHTFAHKVVGGPRPQNTGVHSIDYSMDRTIGRDAAQRWATIGERESAKDSVVRDARKGGLGVTKEHLVLTPDRDYRVITEPERVAINEGRAKRNSVMKSVADAIKKQP